MITGSCCSANCGVIRGRLQMELVHRLQPDGLPDPGGPGVVAGLVVEAPPTACRAPADPPCGSRARTTMVISWPGTATSLRSAVIGVKPPRCRATSVPFTQTVASWSTAPRCNSTRFRSRPQPSRHSIGTDHAAVPDRRSDSRRRRFPEASDSGANGTMIVPLNGRSGQPTFEPRVAPVDLELPLAVQAEPAITHHLRTRIFRTWYGGGHGAAPRVVRGCGDCSDDCSGD